MVQPSKKRKRGGKKEAQSQRTAESAQLDRSVRRIMLGILVTVVAVFVGLNFWSDYRHRKVSRENFRKKYNLSEEQLARTVVLEAEHHRRYRPLASRAIESKSQFDAAQRKAKNWTPELQRLLNQANAASETCWSEEIEHQRRMSESMPPEGGKRYREGEELHYKQRKRDARGLLPLPHM